MFEQFALALETVGSFGTAVTPPTDHIQGEGMITATRTRVRGRQQRGTLAEYGRSKVVRKGAEWDASLDLDAYTLPVFLAMGVKNVTSPTTPTDAVAARLWTYARSLTADQLRAATMFWGDPNIQMFRSTYAMLEELTITSDAGSEDLSQLELAGFAQYPTKVSAPSMPALTQGDLIAPGDLQVWIDTSSAIGTTAITGKVVSATHKLTNNLSQKYLAQGPGNTRNYVRHGRGPLHMETTVVFEVDGTTQYDQWDAETALKVRVRHNGPLIETQNSTDFYNYVQVDTYGAWDEMSWGDHEGTNRTIELTVSSEMTAAAISATYDWAMAVQCTRTTL